MTLRTRVLFLITCLASVGGGVWLSSLQQAGDAPYPGAAARPPIQGALISPPRKIAIPPLLKDDGTAFTLDDLTGKWHLFFFGYTHCPDICPNTMNALSNARKQALDKAQDFPQVVFVSVDPDRDKVDILGDYVRYFDESFYGVTGEADMIKALTLQMNVVYMKQAYSEDSDQYNVGHSSALLLMNPQARLVASLKSPHDPATIMADIQKVISLQK